MEMVSVSSLDGEGR